VSTPSDCVQPSPRSLAAPDPAGVPRRSLRFLEDPKPARLALRRIRVFRNISARWHRKQAQHAGQNEPRLPHVHDVWERHEPSRPALN
jgi:hypothetical protein